MLYLIFRAFAFTQMRCYWSYYTVFPTYNKSKTYLRWHINKKEVTIYEIKIQSMFLEFQWEIVIDSSTVYKNKKQKSVLSPSRSPALLSCLSLRQVRLDSLGCRSFTCSGKERIQSTMITDYWLVFRWMIMTYSQQLEPPAGWRTHCRSS